MIGCMVESWDDGVDLMLCSDEYRVVVLEMGIGSWDRSFMAQGACCSEANGCGEALVIRRS